MPLRLLTTKEKLIIKKIKREKQSNEALSYLIDRCKDLQNELDRLQSRELFFFFFFQIENNIPLTDLQKAGRYLYIIRYSFGSKKTTFATAPKDTMNIIEKLPIYEQRLRKVIIENVDFERLIKTYDRRNALFYLDPPYVNSEQYYTAYQFSESDHCRLYNVLKNISGKFILSYNDCEFVRNLYKNYNIKSVSRINLLSSTGRNQTKFNEVIITNY